MTDCIFCKIVERKIPANIVYEDELTLGFADVSPQAPVHILVIPKKHIPTILDIGEDDIMLTGRLIEVCKKIARDKGIAETGFRIITNCNQEGGQAVYHLHMHLLGGRQLHVPLG